MEEPGPCGENRTPKAPVTDDFWGSGLINVELEEGTMSEIKQMLAKAERVEIEAVPIREDFYVLSMNPALDPAIADLEVCWQLVLQRD